jgi:hypothetical protein
MSESFVVKHKKHFDDNFYEYTQLFSGNKADMIPVYSVSIAGKNRVNFQVPGGSSFAVDVVIAIKWAQSILDICQTALVYKDKSEAKE